MTHGFASQPVTHGPHISEIPSHGRSRLLTWSFCAALGGLLFGFDTGVVSGALLFIREDFDLNAVEQGAVVSILLLSAAATAPFSGRIADRYGRRRCLLVIALIFIIGLGLAALSPDIWSLLLARLILGFGVGGASTIVPVYLSEIAPTKIRGALVSMNQVMITAGLLVSYIVALVLSASGNWRGMFGVGIVAAVAMLLGMIIAPETPAWLERNGHDDRARKVLGKYLPADRINTFLDAYRSAREEKGETTSWRAMFSSPAIRPALMIGLGLAMLQQFCGINTIMYFAPTIMETTGLNASNALVYSIAIGAINLIMTLLALRFIDTAGRRTMLLISVGCMMLATIPMGMSFTVLSGNASSLVALISILVYIMAFSIGLGPIFWLINSEIYPPQIRAEAAGLGTMTNWLANFLISQSFLPVAQAIGEGQTFWVFGVICGLAFLFIAARVPETKNRTVDQIDTEIQRRWRHA